MFMGGSIIAVVGKSSFREGCGMEGTRESWKWEKYSPRPAGKFSPKSHAHALPHRTLQGKD
jgi:hypothetical protein